MKKSFLAAIACCIALVPISCDDDEKTIVVEPTPTPEQLSASLATDWIDLQLYFITKSPGFTPPVVSRAFAYCGIAFYEALVPSMLTNVSLQGQLNGIATDALPLPDETLDYYFPLAANAAAAEMTRRMFENAPVPDLPKIDSLELVYKTNLQTTLDSEVVDRSIAYGKSIASALYTLSITDGGHRGFNRNFPASYIPPKGPGLWIPTNSQLALLPSWGNNKTFIADLSTKVTAPGHAPFSTAENSHFFEQAMEVYTISKTLTSEQQSIAYFWNDDALATYTPPGHSMCILNQLLIKENKSLAFAAIAYAQLSIALSDAFVICWKVKYADNLMRPVTYIQQNIDEFWNSRIITPPFPEYTSGHSTQAGATAAVLNNLFGESYSFTDQTHTRLATDLSSRSYTSFDAMADECSISRLYGGIHFTSGNVHGKQMGYQIGAEVLKLRVTKE